LVASENLPITIASDDLHTCNRPSRIFEGLSFGGVEVSCCRPKLSNAANIRGENNRMTLLCDDNFKCSVLASWDVMKQKSCE
jgi:hypothetical protein